MSEDIKIVAAILATGMMQRDSTSSSIEGYVETYRQMYKEIRKREEEDRQAKSDAYIDALTSRTSI